jgi:(1->4)-alpha-D-glucan 1-alpha-D-glucosylmutase
VIGEDLGTVPDAVRDALRPLGVLSYRLLYFEKDATGNFKAPPAYEKQAVVMASTHDLPTLAGFWAGTDLEQRQRLGLFPSAERYEQQVIARAEDRARLLLALQHEGLLPEGMSGDPVSVPELTPALAQAIHSYLARTPARLLMIQPQDLLGEKAGESARHHERASQLAAQALAGDRTGETPASRRCWRHAGRRGVSSFAATAREMPLLVSVDPRAYRLQLRKDTFADATRSLSRRTGHQCCYCSLSQARPGGPGLTSSTGGQPGDRWGLAFHRGA